MRKIPTDRAEHEEEHFPIRAQGPRRVFLFGCGISNSISPAIQNRAFKEVGLDIQYGLLDVDEAKFSSKMNELKTTSDVLGFNVTIPYKEKILPHLDDLDTKAKSAGAVNTVRIEIGRERRMFGYNTDVDGVIATLSKLGVIGRGDGLRGLIIGAGGAARGCLCAILNNGFDYVTILNRTQERARDLVSDFRRTFPDKHLECGALTRSRLEESLYTSLDLMINTVPATAKYPFEPKLSSASNWMKVFDLNYSGVPPVLREAQKMGLVCIDGILMLVEQAARSFEIWTGVSAPRKAMMLAAKRETTESKKKITR